MTTPSGPLGGLKVIEFSVFMAGPTCGLMLADLGAEVIKIERVPDGDDTRRMAPPTIGGEPASFMIMNRNKRGLAIDAKSKAGLAVLRRLCLGADIVIENFRPGVLDRLGLGYEELAKANPGLVYGSITGFGLTGPDSDRPGLDLIAQGFSGLMSITGEGPGRPPVKVGAPVSDTTAGILLALGVVSAHHHKLRTGRGQHVDTSLIEAAMVHTYWQSAIALATGESPGPMGSAHPLNAPYQAFQAADGWFVLGAPNNTNFRRLLEAIEATHLGDDPRFAEPGLRLANKLALELALNEVFRTRPRDHWLQRLEVAGVPSGPVHSIGETLAHPQTRARNMVVEVTHERAGRVETLGCPIKFSETPATIRKGAPVYGAESVSVLGDFGFDETEIRDLVAAGVIATKLPAEA